MRTNPPSAIPKPCSGPGYIPNDRETLIAYFEGVKQEYHKQLTFWRKRVEPANKREIDKDMSKNWEHISQIPGELRPKKGAVSNEAAKDFWMKRILDVDNKLNMLN